MLLHYWEMFVMGLVTMLIGWLISLLGQFAPLAH